jgi:alkylhydroperoxidase/carboxymuconolactone decarboxylase family protein YurZ
MADRRSKNFNYSCPDPMTMAERELSAFFNAIAQLFGEQQAEISANEWLEELMETDGLPSSTRDWRLITMKASTRLASRVKASSLSESSILSERMFV